MKVAIYSPYLDTLGGGEKYMMTIAEAISQKHHVDVFLDQHLNNLGAEYLKNQLSQRFDLNLHAVNFTKAPIGKHSSVINRLFFLVKYDVFFYLTDGSIFFPTAKKNILHIQSPLAGQPAKNIWGKVKLKGWDLIIYNSIFTQKHAKIYWPIKSEVIYPPVDVNKIKPSKKKKYILSVGRFFGYLKDKKHAVLIKAFEQLYKNKKMGGWSLNLAGAASEGDISYLQELKKLSEGYPVSFYPNIEYHKLVELYGESAIYWHAAGFDEDDPAHMEHFGISTAEAMAGGCVPVVVNKGGQTEIVKQGKSGFLWNSLKELGDYTTLLANDQSLMAKLSQKALSDSQNFSKSRFEKEIIKLI